MSHAASQGDGQISRIHTLSLSQEIGERLRFHLDSERTSTPLPLLNLMARFQRAVHPGD